MINVRSIQFRLIVWYSCLIIAVSLTFGVFTYHNLRQQLYSDMEQGLSRRERQISLGVLTHTADPAAIANLIHSVYMPEVNNRFIRIFDANHKVIYQSGNPQDEQFTSADIPIVKEPTPPSRIEQLAFQNSMLVTANTESVNGSSYLIEVGILTNEIERPLHNLLIALVYGLPVVILIVSGGGYMLVMRAMKPVEAIRATAEQITFGNLSNRLPVATTGDALEHLSVTLNQMLDRLEDAYEQASRFSADASHELRTPLAILRGELESIVRESGLSPSLRERIGSVLEETERLSHITESLFTISRLDAGEAKIQHARFDLAEMVQNTAEQMALLSEVKKIKVNIAIENPVPINGDSSRIKQVVVNLLDNAIKYTAEGGSILIKVSMVSNKAVLEVIDNGVGIPAPALPHVFERFYRADKARSRDLGGAGLGLAIVRSICLAHGGSVDIQSVEGKGTICKVELPLAGDEA